MSRPATCTKEKLIATALELIWQSSYGNVSVDGICKAAGIQKGSFYHYFPSKIDLALAALEQGFTDYKDRLDAVFSPTVSPIKRFEDFADICYEKQKEVYETYGKVCGCPMASLGSEMAGNDEKLRQKTAELFARKEKYYKSALRDLVAEGLLPKDIDIDVKATDIRSYIMGVMMMARIQNDLEYMRTDLKRGLMRIIGVNQVTKIDA